MLHQTLKLTLLLLFIW